MSEARHVYWLQLLASRRETEKPFRIVFESRHPSVEDLVAELDERGVTAGSKLHLVDDGRGGKLIRAREGFAFGVIGLVSLQTFQHPCWEPEE